MTEIDDLGSAGSDAIALTAAGIAVSVLIGAARGMTIGFGARDGHLWMRYRWSTIVLWVVNIVAKFALVPLGLWIGVGPSALSQQSIMVAVGLGLVAESAVVHLRSRRVARELGVNVAWSTDRDGTVRTSPIPAGADTTWKS